MKAITIISLIVLLNACSLFKQTLNDENKSNWPRLKLEQQAMEVNAFQIIHARFLKRDEKLQAAVEITNNQLQVILLSSTGQRLATMISTEGETALSTDVPFPINVPLAEILESFEQIYSKDDALKQKLAENERWSYQHTGLTRKFFLDEKIYSEIVYTSANPWDGELTYKNYKHNYRFHIISSLVTQ